MMHGCFETKVQHHNSSSSNAGYKPMYVYVYYLSGIQEAVAHHVSCNTWWRPVLLDDPQSQACCCRFKLAGCLPVQIPIIIAMELVEVVCWIGEACIFNFSLQLLQLYGTLLLSQRNVRFMPCAFAPSSRA